MIGNPSYPTYQIFLALGISAALCALIMPLFIRFMKQQGFGQQIRADGPQEHLVKHGTPTMGGLIMLVSMLITTALLARWSIDLILAVAATLLIGSLGLLDDIKSVAKRRSLGLTPLQKMIGLGLLSVIFCLTAVNVLKIPATLSFPGGFVIDLGILTTQLILGDTTLSIPWLYIIFVFFLMAGFSNAVNLTDGLDGLASGCSMVVLLAMAMVAFRFEETNLAIFAASLSGACMGFLWHNCHPATIFMGDTGSLALGGAFAALAVLTKTEVTSSIMGGLFIVEVLSDIAQVLYFRSTKKRIFLMAPIHHHFEKKGWSETKVVVRFWIISAAFAALGFALYFQMG